MTVDTSVESVYSHVLDGGYSHPYHTESVQQVYQGNRPANLYETEANRDDCGQSFESLAPTVSSDTTEICVESHHEYGPSKIDKPPADQCFDRAQTFSTANDGACSQTAYHPDSVQQSHDSSLVNKQSWEQSEELNYTYLLQNQNSAKNPSSRWLPGSIDCFNKSSPLLRNITMSDVLIGRVFEQLSQGNNILLVIEEVVAFTRKYEFASTGKSIFANSREASLLQLAWTVAMGPLDNSSHKTRLPQMAVEMVCAKSPILRRLPFNDPVGGRKAASNLRPKYMSGRLEWRQNKEFSEEKKYPEVAGKDHIYLDPNVDRSLILETVTSCACLCRPLLNRLHVIFDLASMQKVSMHDLQLEDARSVLVPILKSFVLRKIRDTRKRMQNNSISPKPIKSDSRDVTTLEMFRRIVQAFPFTYKEVCGVLANFMVRKVFQHPIWTELETAQQRKSGNFVSSQKRRDVETPSESVVHQNPRRRHIEMQDLADQLMRLAPSDKCLGSSFLKVFRALQTYSAPTTEESEFSSKLHTFSQVGESLPLLSLSMLQSLQLDKVNQEVNALWLAHRAFTLNVCSPGIEAVRRAIDSKVLLYVALADQNVDIEPLRKIVLFVARFDRECAKSLFDALLNTARNPELIIRLFGTFPSSDWHILSGTLNEYLDSWRPPNEVYLIRALRQLNKYRHLGDYLFRKAVALMKGLGLLANDVDIDQPSVMERLLSPPEMVREVWKMSITDLFSIFPFLEMSDLGHSPNAAVPSSEALLLSVADFGILDHLLKEVRHRMFVAFVSYVFVVGFNWSTPGTSAEVLP